MELGKKNKSGDNRIVLNVLGRAALGWDSVEQPMNTHFLLFVEGKGRGVVLSLNPGKKVQGFSLFA